MLGLLFLMGEALQLSIRLKPHNSFLPSRGESGRSHVPKIRSRNKLENVKFGSKVFCMETQTFPTSSRLLQHSLNFLFKKFYNSLWCPHARSRAHTHTQKKSKGNKERLTRRRRKKKKEGNVNACLCLKGAGCHLDAAPR